MINFSYFLTNIYLPLGSGNASYVLKNMYDYLLSMMVRDHAIANVEAVNFKSTSRLARLFFLLTKYPPSYSLYFHKFRANPCMTVIPIFPQFVKYR